MATVAVEEVEEPMDILVVVGIDCVEEVDDTVDICGLEEVMIEVSLMVVASLVGTIVDDSGCVVAVIGVEVNGEFERVVEASVDEAL